MIRLNLDKQVSLTYYDQIKGQLLSAIYCGKIKEGDRLPSMRELAEGLEGDTDPSDIEAHVDDIEEDLEDLGDDLAEDVKHSVDEAVRGARKRFLVRRGP